MVVVEVVEGAEGSKVVVGTAVVVVVGANPQPSLFKFHLPAVGVPQTHLQSPEQALKWGAWGGRVGDEVPEDWCSGLNVVVVVEVVVAEGCSTSHRPSLDFCTLQYWLSVAASG